MAEKKKPQEDLVKLAGRAMTHPEKLTGSEIKRMAARILDDQRNDPEAAEHKPSIAAQVISAVGDLLPGAASPSEKSGKGKDAQGKGAKDKGAKEKNAPEPVPAADQAAAPKSVEPPKPTEATKPAPAKSGKSSPAKKAATAEPSRQDNDVTKSAARKGKTAKK